MMSTSGHVIKNTAYLYVKMIITMVVSLYTARVFLNVLGASDYGLYQLVAGTIALFAFLQDTLVLATLRYLCFYKGKNDFEKENSVFNISIILHFALSLIITIALLSVTNFLFGGFLNIPSERIDVAKFVYYLMIVTSLLSIMSIPYDSVLNANENMLYFSVIGIIEAILKLILALVLSYSPIDKLVFFGIGTALITLISLVIRRVYCHAKYKECRYNFKLVDKGILKDMVSYAGWNMLTGVTAVFVTNATSIVLNKFFGTLVNAAQGVANQVNATLLQFSGNIQKSINPIINKSYGENDEKRMLRLSYSGSKLSFVIFFFICVPIIVEAPYIMRIWLKNVPEWTVIFCQILLIRSLFRQLTTYFSNCIYATGNIKNYCIIKSIFNAISVVAMIIAFYVGLPPYYAYISLFIFFEFIGGIIILAYCKRLFTFSIRDYFINLLIPSTILLVTELIVGYGVTNICKESFLRLLLNTTLITGTTVLLSWELFFSKEERDLIVGMKKSFTNRVKQIKKKK